MFTAPNVVEAQDFAFDHDGLGGAQIAVRTHYSLISPGTELACLAGIESWAPHPFAPGYAACGEVLAVGDGVREVRPGDRVFTYTGHASHAKTDSLYAKVPDGLDMKLVPFARMAAVSITSLRVSAAELGDRVAVIGLGLVGNLAAQLFTLAGCEVIGIDVSAHRRELARQCGVAHVVDGGGDVAAAIADLTGGAMCETVVEATGLPALAETSATLAGKQGEVILLGSPRGAHTADLTPFLNQIHIWGNCVTFKGAHEWRFPRVKDPQGFQKHSLPRNIEILLKLIAAGRLHVEPLLTHVLPPERAPEAYAGLRERKDEWLGVVFDWGAWGARQIPGRPR
jgi:2-desacetyl-2-hydroxyethyl bacteriochlorophyllide A dehydrogenase